jgi:hypothetical protein
MPGANQLERELFHTVQKLPEIVAMGGTGQAGKEEAPRWGGRG